MEAERGGAGTAEAGPGEPPSPAGEGLSEEGRSEGPAASNAETMNRILALVNAGELAEAEAACEEILEENPHDAQILNSLGVVAFRKGEYGRAAECIGKAIVQVTLYSARFHANLAVVW